MSQKLHKFDSGFTLVELVVVIAILGILLAFAIIAINPFAQLAKLKDAQRKADFEQIHAALDLYYNDNHCYPPSMTFDSAWKVGDTVYMSHVPQDPDCYKTGYCYVYRTQSDSTNNFCPQWAVLYTRLSKKLSPAELQESCPTRKICSPPFVSAKYNYCRIAGLIDCSYLRSNLPITPTSIPTPPGTPTSVPTPTPPGGGGICSCDVAEYVLANNICNHSGTPGPSNYCDENCSVPCQ